MSLQIIDTDFPESMNEVKKMGRLNENTLKKCESYIETTLLSLFEKTKNLNADIFEIKNMLFRFHNDKFLEYKDDILLKTTPRFLISAKNYI